MLKKFSRFLLIVFLVFIVSSCALTCLAHEENEIANQVTSTEVEGNETSNTNSTEENTTENIHTGNLYLFGNNLVMDKLVDGDVFIIGNKVKITGQINGSLYVIANQISFDGALVRHSIYTCANYMYYNNSGTYENESNAYIIAHTLETTYSSYISRDAKILASDVTFKSAMGRNVDIICNTLSLGEDKDVAEIWGNLNYIANNELVISEDIVKGNVTYSKQYFGNSITGILIAFGICIVTSLATYIILKKLTPKFIENIYANKISAVSLLKALGIGLATIITIAIFIILLAGTGVGILLAIILSLLFVILYIIATPILSIRITHSLKNIIKVEKNYLSYVLIILVTIILHSITLIPFLGFILGLIINIISIGLIVNVFLPHREPTEEEKLIIEEKEKAKKEKAELKATKKQEKLEAKNVKKEEKKNNKK